MQTPQHHRLHLRRSFGWLICASQLMALVHGAEGTAAVLSLSGSTTARGGSPWTLRNHNGSISVPATVPGVVHLDLLRADKIAEPYYRYGELDQAWVGTST